MSQQLNTSHDVPVHIGIIMDGNGRWAQAKGLPRTAGHKEGLNAAREIIKEAKQIGIKYLTLYTFSTENWKRTQEEVGFLMNLVKTHLRKEFEFYRDEKVRLQCVGDLTGLPQDVQKEIYSVQEDSKNFDALNVVLAINYGGRDEIIRGIKKLYTENKELIPTLTEMQLQEHFDIPDFPDVDLIIRTGGDKRISNFLLWHGAYSELEFTDTYWPDYSPANFRQHIENFVKRNRRFGGI